MKPRCFLLKNDIFVDIDKFYIATHTIKIKSQGLLILLI